MNTTILSNDRMPQGLQNEIYDKPTPITCAMCDVPLSLIDEEHSSSVVHPLRV